MYFSDDQKFKTLMCPITPQTTKLVNRYIQSMFKKKENKQAGAELCQAQHSLSLDLDNN